MGKRNAESFDVVIVGSGFAGAATAFFLSRRRGLRILVLEQEPTAGVHSSGRNAALVRQACGDSRLDALAAEGAAFLRAPPEDFLGRVELRAVGSYLVATEATREGLLAGGAAREVPLDRLRRQVPIFDPEPGGTALYTPGDGVVDIHALLEGYLRSAASRGVRLAWGEAAERILAPDGVVVGVAASGREIRCKIVVNAAGAWAETLATSCGARERGLTPLRRHLGFVRTAARLDPRWPWVWDLARGFYFRPESGGLLVSACDEEPDSPGHCAADPVILESLAEKARQCLPGLEDLTFERFWAGHRTRAPDSRFCLGVDPEVPGLVWAAGLGGHGVTTSAAVGREVAEATLRALEEGGVSVQRGA
jgi:D-arginine dehydrogenase